MGARLSTRDKTLTPMPSETRDPRDVWHARTWGTPGSRCPTSWLPDGTDRARRSSGSRGRSEAELRDIRRLDEGSRAAFCRSSPTNSLLKASGELTAEPYKHRWA